MKALAAGALVATLAIAGTASAQSPSAAGVDVNAANATGDTALHTASTTGGGLHSVIRLLVERGGRLDAKNKAERTPLDAATRSRQPNEKTIALLKELSGR